MPSDSLEVITAVWRYALLGGGLLLVGVAAGWALGRTASFPPVRLIEWWIRLVVLPLLRCRSWWRRAGTIFVNNISLLAVLAAAGRWHMTAIVVIAGLGLSLGIGLRLLAGKATSLAYAIPAPASPNKRRVRIGVVLNLLEPPAIMLTIGLSLGYARIPLSASQVVETFVLWVLPASLLAAAGEALWMGAALNSSPGKSEAE